MERTQFTFYESFYRAISRIRSPEGKVEAYDAICRYALYGEEPDMDAISETAAMVFDLVKPTLDSSRKKAENGKSGGAKSKTEANASKPEANRSKVEANGSKTEANRSKAEANASEKEKEKEKEKEYECNPPTPLPGRKKQPKVQFAENVTMTNDEYERLLATHGAADTQRLIEILDNYKGSTGKKYTSDYRAVLSWCVDRLAEQKAKAKTAKSMGPYAPQQDNTGARANLERMERYRREMEARREQQE